jgi:hypothetical protein
VAAYFSLSLSLLPLKKSSLCAVGNRARTLQESTWVQRVLVRNTTGRPTVHGVSCLKKKVQLTTDHTDHVLVQNRELFRTLKEPGGKYHICTVLHFLSFFNDVMVKRTLARTWAQDQPSRTYIDTGCRNLCLLHSRGGTWMTPGDFNIRSASDPEIFAR